MRRLLSIIMAAGLLVACTADTNSSGEASAVCPPDNASVARVWNDTALDAIRRDFPAPTVHARNLFHLSTAMWDAWAAFDADAVGYFTTTVAKAEDQDQEQGSASRIRELIEVGPDADRLRVISFAAHTVLTARYGIAVGADASLEQFDATLTALCLDPADPDPLGVAIGQATLAASKDDGSNEDEIYVADYAPVNEPLVIRDPGTTMADPNRWQQLEFEIAMTQNGQLLETNVQEYVGPHWGTVAPFALGPAPNGLPIDPGPPPLLGTPTQDGFVEQAIDVIRASSQLNPADGVIIDISPATRGNNTIGQNNGTGHDTNPVTGDVYEPNPVAAGDFHRVIAEFWADGPDSETPPGHWNTLANQASDQLDSYVIGGAGGEPGTEDNEVDRLKWDASMYLALNGALHDAAIAAWGAKAHYDYTRPISMIRHLAGLGVLPETPGLVEFITEASAAPGERHADLADHVGEIAIFAWAPDPVFFGEDLQPVRWIRAVEWVPYQRRTFVTPAFPGYVSGHSTFSRAAAEVLTAITGSPYFPGGLFTHTTDELEFEDGPTDPVELQWATYYDAADEAGLSRIYGGIHPEVDDLAGRLMGAEVGRNAWAHASTFFG